MNLAHTIYAHAQALPDHLQREALDFITYLEQRHKVQPRSTAPLTTAQFVERFAGSLGDDFPDDINPAVCGQNFRGAVAGL